MKGYDFHRQKPIDNYILDFFCHELMLGIKIDGYSHQLEEVIERDEKKEQRLSELGIHILRFSDQEVFNEMENVRRKILEYIRVYESK